MPQPNPTGPWTLPHPPLPLAASTSVSTIILLCLVLIGLLLIGLMVVSYVRKSIRGEDELGPVGGFNLSELRRLRDTGELSAEQYEKAVHAMVTTTHAKIDQKAQDSK